MRRRASVFILLAAAGCDSEPLRPDPEPVAVIVTPQVNVQLGDTRAGEEPGYIVTGQVIATQSGVRVDAVVDSVVIRYRVDNGAWIRHNRRTSVPFSDQLPFTAVAGQRYDLWAIMYARGTGAGASAEGTDEWLASGMGIQ